jgi:hypothetical protein
VITTVGRMPPLGDAALHLPGPGRHRGRAAAEPLPADRVPPTHSGLRVLIPISAEDVAAQHLARDYARARATGAAPGTDRNSPG